MIAYYLETDTASPPAWPKAFCYKGEVLIMDDPALVPHVILGTKANGIRKLKSTLFDESSVPPRLIREDFAIAALVQFGAVLPPTFFDMRGDIRDAKGALVMRGPDGTD